MRPCAAVEMHAVRCGCPPVEAKENCKWILTPDDASRNTQV
jgi:hypothetical protein